MNLRTFRINPYILAVAGAIMAAILGALLFTSPSHAADANKFNPGNIIDDVVFYNDSSMSAAQIQTFLNSKNPNCDTNGTQPASDWGRSDITHATLASYIRNGTNGYTKDTGFHAPPYVCTKDYKQNTPQMEAASGLCAGLSAKTNRTAAQIIKDVSSACKINPQVLLVLLQKEQSLITDFWPLNRQYQKATGFDCPDSAPCDPAYAGFFYQVYYAARQFKIYQAYPNNYNYIAGRTNRIYWQTNLGNWVNTTGNYNSSRSNCGYSNVYIENQATAALYIYTPYQPNQKALTNLYGTGDSCSAYGNRNFWRLFTDWFGATTKPGETAISARYEALSTANKNSLGASTSSVKCNLRNSGCYKLYSNGAIIWSASTGAWESFGPIRERWSSLKLENGSLGYPTKGISCGLTKSGCWQAFENGYIVWSSGSGAWESMGGIRKYWNQVGAENGTLGYPVGAETTLSNGWFQKYENGYIIGNTKTGFWISDGAIRTRWTQIGAENGKLGYPTGPTSCDLVGSGCWQPYEKGYIVQPDANQAWESTGGIRRYWTQIGAENGKLGYPMGPETALNDGGWFQKYANGYVIGKTKTGFWESEGSARTRWTQLGAENGKLGYPTTSVTCGLANNGCYQGFEKGYIIWSNSTGPWESLFGPIRTHWIQNGSESGALGYPTGPLTTVNSTTTEQHFTNGVIHFKLPSTAWVTAP